MMILVPSDFVATDEPSAFLMIVSARAKFEPKNRTTAASANYLPQVIQFFMLAMTLTPDRKSSIQCEDNITSELENP